MYTENYIYIDQTQKVEINEVDQTRKDIINKEAREKYFLLDRQKRCIAKYKRLQKYFETVDFDHIDTNEQNKLLLAYLFCQHAGRYHNFKLFANYVKTNYLDPYEQIKNVTPFDIKKFASTLMGMQDCKETDIWLDNTFLEGDYEWRDYSRDDWYLIKRILVHVICPSDFDDKKNYSQKEILELAKSKKIFLLSLERFSNKIYCDLYPSGCSQIKFKSGIAKTTQKITLTEEYTKNPRTITIPAGTRLEEKEFNSKPFDCFCSWNKTPRKDKFNTYLESIQQIYPNFVTVYLKQLAEELPNEILARTKQAKQTHMQIKTFIEESYAKYKVALENELQRIESDRQKQLDEVKTEPKYDESKFEF